MPHGDTKSRPFLGGPASGLPADRCADHPYYLSKKLTLDQARVLSSWVGVTGFFALNSDWLLDLPAERLEIIKRILPAHGVTARPVDYFDNRFMTTWDQD